MVSFPITELAPGREHGRKYGNMDDEGRKSEDRKKGSNQRGIKERNKGETRKGSIMSHFKYIEESSTAILVSSSGSS